MAVEERKSDYSADLYLSIKESDARDLIATSLTILAAIIYLEISLSVGEKNSVWV